MKTPSLWQAFISEASLFCLVLSCSALCHAQADSLADCFPLSVGNQWSFHSDITIVLDEYAGYNDTGIARYVVLGKSDATDSTVWHLMQRRTYRRVWFSWGSHTPDSTSSDSTAFDLIELKSGRHELHRNGGSISLNNRSSSCLWNSVMPFVAGQPDTGRMYRYWPVDSTGEAHIFLLLASYSIGFQITLKEDSGISDLGIADFLMSIGGPSGGEYTRMSGILTGVHDGWEYKVPKNFTLLQNYPNPFNPTTTIRYQLPKSSFVRLSIFNILGQQVRTLVNQTEQPGYKSVSFDGSNLPSGMYFYRITARQTAAGQAGAFTDVKKMVLIK